MSTMAEFAQLLTRVEALEGKVEKISSDLKSYVSLTQTDSLLSKALEKMEDSIMGRLQAQLKGPIQVAESRDSYILKQIKESDSLRAQSLLSDLKKELNEAIPGIKQDIIESIEQSYPSLSQAPQQYMEKSKIVPELPKQLNKTTKKKDESSDEDILGKLPPAKATWLKDLGLN